MVLHRRSEVDEGLLLRSLAPRPLVWVTTQDANGSFNMAPFSAVTIVTVDPPTLLLIIQPSKRGGRKHTVTNILATSEFVVNAIRATELERLMQSAAPDTGEAFRDEISKAGTAPSEMVAVARLISAPYSLECRLTRHEALVGGVELLFADILCIHAEAVPESGPSSFVGALGYEWFVSDHGLQFVPQPYLTEGE